MARQRSLERELAEEGARRRALERHVKVLHTELAQDVVPLQAAAFSITHPPLRTPLLAPSPQPCDTVVNDARRLLGGRSPAVAVPPPTVHHSTKRGIECRAWSPRGSPLRPQQRGAAANAPTFRSP